MTDILTLTALSIAVAGFVVGVVVVVVPGVGQSETVASPTLDSTAGTPV